MKDSKYFFDIKNKSDASQNIWAAPDKTLIR